MSDNVSIINICWLMARRNYLQLGGSRTLLKTGEPIKGQLGGL